MTVLLFLVTQKKRLVNKISKIKLEIIRLAVRLLVLGGLLALFVDLPNMIAFSYGIPVSAVIALLLTDLDIVMMILCL